MIRKRKLPHLAVPLGLVLGLALAGPAMADSVTAEQAQGAQVLSQIQHGTLNPKGLTNDQYQNLGEYLMGRSLASTQLHQRMNTLMDQMMGPTAADQMHIYLGKRFLGVSATPSSQYSQLYGLMGVMMSGYRGSTLAGMMGAYLNGQGAPGYTMGPGMMGSLGYGSAPAASSSSGWPTGAVIAVGVLALVLVVGAVAFAVPRVRRRSHGASAATT